MTKHIFTSEQVEQLRANPYVKNVPEKSITYSDEFKRHFVSESLDNQVAKQLFINSGFDPEVLGKIRIKAFSKKWRKKYSESGILS